MTEDTAPIRRYVEVRRHPTVVRLQDLETPGSAWLEETFVLTAEVRRHLDAIAHVLRRGAGGGVFLIGQYGSGKSHLLAYLTLRLRGGAVVESPPDVVPLSLVNYGAANRLEDIVSAALGLRARPGDRRPAWDGMLAAHGRGLLLAIDELSEFLRAKKDAGAFNEDVRFLQFLGEWAQEKRFWIVAAMQEGIEHTGEIEYGLYRKIKDRYPLRLILSPAHVRSLIADGILLKKPGYDAEVARLCQNLRKICGDSRVDLTALQSIYPIHPSTLELLEEVRDRFSQARGVVDFSVTRLAGDAARGVEPFLDRPFGSLLTPDVIVEHFQDLLDMQPEFLPVSQHLFPWYRRHMPEVFELPAQRELAEKLLRLLVLVHLSGARDELSVEDAAAWLLVSASHLEPDRNRKIVARLLGTLAERGRYVVARNGCYHLDLGDDGGAALERLLARETESLQGQDALVLETLIGLLPASEFNPFQLPRDQWQHRRVLWHFHERSYAVWLGNEEPAAADGIGLCLRLPWAATPPARECYTVQPSPLAATPDLVELAALVRLREQPLPPELRRRIEQRLQSRAHLARRALRSAWQEAEIITPEGKREPAPRLEPQSTLDSWLETVALWMLRRTYPSFERFAPGHGPLPKEAWLRFMRFASANDIGATDADDYVKLIREAYLVPMGLLRRSGREYVTPANLEQNELVRLVTPLLEHNPAPQVVHAHLAEPVYGLAPDQINLLLVFLLLQGAIDILKERKSYRDSFELLPNPLQYDRIVPGHALSEDQTRALERLCDALAVKRPAHWTVLTQRRCAAQLAEVRRKHVERLEPLVRQLEGLEQGISLAERIQQHIDRWSALDAGRHELQGLQQLLFEIGSPAAFVDEVKFFEGLPFRLQQLLADTRRYTHLLRQPAVQQSLAGEDLGDPPGLEEPERLDQWLKRAAQVYADYRKSYGERHDRWWRQVAGHPIWEWKAPAVARSRHVGLREALETLETSGSEALRRRCRGLVDLDYQPQCACGFDGETAPIESLLGRFDAARETVETRLRLFFQQDSVKARLRQWQREGVEMTSGTLSYLEGECDLPEVRDLPALDDYLGGAELAVDVDVGSVIETLHQRLWEPAELIDALARQVRARGGRRLRFTGGLARGIPHNVLEWCAEQTSRYGIRLPAGLSREELGAITKALRPEWIQPPAVRRLESLGLDDGGVDRVLGWLADGTLALPEGRWRDDSQDAAVPAAQSGGAGNAAVPAAQSGGEKEPARRRRYPKEAVQSELVRVIADLRSGHGLPTPRGLAALSERSYRSHPRLWRVAGRCWLDHLDAVAKCEIEPLPPLVEVLNEHGDAQWIVLDAAGLPLLGTVQAVLSRLLAEWQPAEPCFAEVSNRTTTAACYRDLLRADLISAFNKIDAIDELLHGGVDSFTELVASTMARLEGALQRLLPKLEPEKPLVVFADHGFRLAEDGRSYVHGGASTLERVVPVWCFIPRAGRGG